LENPAETSERILLFVYGLLLEGEREHELLGKAKLVAKVRTQPGYTLVDLDFYPALLVGGQVAVLGELYEVDKRTRFELDVHKQCPALFQRLKVTLEDGSEAETYVMQDEQVRGKRRIKHGSWRDRFQPRPRSAPGPMGEYAKKRWL
jgi:gamma-glutamylaminecyclotransferase